SLTRLQQPLGRHAEVSALGMVQQPAEERAGIEPGDAQPRDAAVPADQRSGRPVSDQPEVLQRKITGEPPDRTESRVEFEHVVTPRAYAPPPETLRPVMRIFTALGHMRLLRWVTPQTGLCESDRAVAASGDKIARHHALCNRTTPAEGGTKAFRRLAGVAHATGNRRRGPDVGLDGHHACDSGAVWLKTPMSNGFVKRSTAAAQRPRLRTGRARACDRA